jgi:glutamate 5-kinase
MAFSESQVRSAFKDKKRIIVKIGSSSLTHAETGAINLNKVEKLVRQLCDLRNQGKDVVLVSSGAIAVGRKAVGMNKKPQTVCQKQACASIGQARLMMNYQKLFSEYDQVTGQILMTKYTILNPIARQNAHNTMEELFRMGIIPVVNENDTIATDEIHFGDNDTLSALVASLTKADLLILLSDIDGLYTDDPHTNPNAELISFVNEVSSEVEHMAGTTQSDVGTGGMTTKLSAARIASRSGADMVIANGEDLSVIQAIMEGEKVGTVFAANPDDSFKLEDYIAETEQERNLNRRQV